MNTKRSDVENLLLHFLLLFPYNSLLRTIRTAYFQSFQLRHSHALKDSSIKKYFNPLICFINSQSVKIMLF